MIHVLDWSCSHCCVVLFRVIPSTIENVHNLTNRRKCEDAQSDTNLRNYTYTIYQCIFTF